MNSMITTEDLKIKVTKTEKSKLKDFVWENLTFGKSFSDHMLVMNYKDGEWQTPEIKPLDNFSLHPATSAFHYGQSLFEGMKAYKQINGDVIVFRPDKNAERMKNSCVRMCMPPIDEELFVQLVLKFVEVEKDWVSDREGYSLYLRPFMFATDPFVGVKESSTYTFCIFGCPVGAYYSEPVNVKIEEYYTRAAVGGVGRAKVTGNYGPTLYPAKLAQDEGYHQLLWTDGQSHEYIEEAGTMNVMFVKNGVVITPTEEYDTILRGVTKRSVIQIAEKWGLKVEERLVGVKEIIEGVDDGSVTEAFGAGTAATIAPIDEIGYRGKNFRLPPVEKYEFANKVAKYIYDIKTGRAEDVFNWNYKVGK